MAEKTTSWVYQITFQAKNEIESGKIEETVRGFAKNVEVLTFQKQKVVEQPGAQGVPEEFLERPTYG